MTRIDSGVVSLVAELRGHERQAAQELERWKTHHEVRKVIDASAAAITLAAGGGVICGSGTAPFVASLR